MNPPSFCLILFLAIICIASCKKTKRTNGIIAFSRFMKNGNVELFSMMANGENLKRLTTTDDSFNSTVPVVNAHPFFSSNGKFIAFTRALGNDINIFIMKSDGTEVKQVTSGNGQSEVPAVSPDGKRIAFSGNRNGSFEIFTISVDGTNLKQLTFTNAINDGPKYTPDGKYIVFSSDMNGKRIPKNRDIYIMDASTGRNLRRITFGMDNRFSRSISPDGKEIVFSSTRNNVANLYIVNINGKGIRKITNSSGNGNGFTPLPGWPTFNGAITPVWSPDGASIAFSDNSKGDYRVYKLSLRTGKISQLTSDNNDLSLGWQTIFKK